MELPKNITQIGETNQHCKIYVEDYVVSYMKQLNKVACDKDMAVALYGVRKEEDETSYLFMYGACKLTFLQRETRHLSQAQQQEIERERVKYFQEYTFLGYRLLNGEMIEGFHICEQGICRYISGYAQFYEKNDNMLAYMLDVREEMQPESVEREKYEAVRKKQEERRSRYEQEEYTPKKYRSAAPERSSGSLRGMRVAVVTVFALLCMVGIATLNGGGEVKNLQVMARQVMDDVMAQRIPDAEDAVQEASMPVEETGEVNTLIAEDKLTEALLQENKASMPVEGETSDAVAVNAAPTVETSPVENAAPAAETPIEESTVSAPEEQPASYIIKEGDTLIGISIQNYGSDSKVADICALNQIRNPDDIMVGQKILLP